MDIEPGPKLDYRLVIQPSDSAAAIDDIRSSLGAAQGAAAIAVDIGGIVLSIYSYLHHVLLPHGSAHVTYVARLLATAAVHNDRCRTRN